MRNDAVIIGQNELALERFRDDTASFTLDVYGHASQKMRQQSAARMEQYISVVLSN